MLLVGVSGRWFQPEDGQCTGASPAAFLPGMIAFMQGKKPPHEPVGWDEVRLFLALCRARTVGSAAKSLGVDASTASRRLVLLERALGARLFDRSRDGIAATKAA